MCWKEAAYDFNNNYVEELFINENEDEYDYWEKEMIEFNKNNMLKFFSNK